MLSLSFTKQHLHRRQSSNEESSCLNSPPSVLQPLLSFSCHCKRGPAGCGAANAPAGGPLASGGSLRRCAVSISASLPLPPLSPPLPFITRAGEGRLGQYCRANPNRLAISLLISTSLQRCHLLADTPPFNYLHGRRAFHRLLSSVFSPSPLVTAISVPVLALKISPVFIAKKKKRKRFHRGPSGSHASKD